MTDPGSASLSAMIRITDSGQTLRHVPEKGQQLTFKMKEAAN